VDGRIITGETKAGDVRDSKQPRILVANRGEIAVRVFRTCHELGIACIAVYSDADRDGLHVEEADEAYRLGPAAPAESYLNVERILEAARSSGATLIHPGYGFLSENADFARAVAAAGLTFVGPPPDAMEQLGDKAEARRTAARAGAPIVPGTEGPVDAADARTQAERIGFPLVVKAAFGGGGRGMRLVGAPDELDDAVERSAREARAYFGRPEVYLERYITKAHHVEAQILADAHGHVSFLGERDCSMQRRYQKLIEESPSPAVDETLRGRIGEAAIAIAREAGYVNAGTVEFLVEPDGSFYFMEVNARLQVEHPVTEMVTGLDLVKEQIRIAAGEPISVRQDDIRLRGHAIECRIYAEDPFNNFMPSPGRIHTLRSPSGPGIRVDSGIYEGCEVPIHYDPIISKLIAWGRDRDEAIRRMRRALGEYVILGVKTSIPFHLRILEDPQVLAGQIHTQFLEAWLAKGLVEAKGSLAEIALVAGSLYLHTKKPSVPVSAGQGGPAESLWKLAARRGALRR
jgi:acetyl-CoA carboxylase biotin carboxylase subunit